MIVCVKENSLDVSLQQSPLEDTGLDLKAIVSVPPWSSLSIMMVTAGQNMYCDNYIVSGPVVGEHP